VNISRTFVRNAVSKREITMASVMTLKEVITLYSFLRSKCRFNNDCSFGNSRFVVPAYLNGK